MITAITRTFMTITKNMQDKTIEETRDNAKNIAIFGHEYIDGDCLWSMLWLGTILESMNKKVSYFTPYPVGNSLHFVPWREKIQTTFDYDQSYDTLVFLDFSGYDRIKTFTQWNESYFDQKKLIIIDHHEWDHPKTAKFVYKDTQISSACELIYEYSTKRRPEKISEQVATYLYLWLTTDTGNFMYEKDSERTMKNALWLIQAGADKKSIIENIFYHNTFAMIQFSNILIQRAKEEENIIWTYYEDSEIEKHGIDKDQADFGFYTLKTIHGPKLYIRFRKTGEDIRWSLRGNGEINCATLAAQLFNWGWHHNAAWFSIKTQDEDIKKNIKDTVQKIQTYIKNTDQ